MWSQKLVEASCNVDELLKMNLYEEVEVRMPDKKWTKIPRILAFMYLNKLVEGSKAIGKIHAKDPNLFATTDKYFL